MVFFQPRKMSTAQAVMTELSKCRVKELLEPIDPMVSSVEKSTDVNHVLLLLYKKNHVWVVEDKKNLHVIGIITHSDTMSLFGSPSMPLQSYDKPSLQSLQFGLTTTVEEIMSRQPIITYIHETIHSVLEKMYQHKIKQLPVVDEAGCLLGEISLRRIIREYSERQAALETNR